MNLANPMMRWSATRTRRMEVGVAARALGRRQRGSLDAVARPGARPAAAGARIGRRGQGPAPLARSPAPAPPLPPARKCQACTGPWPRRGPRGAMAEAPPLPFYLRRAWALQRLRIHGAGLAGALAPSLARLPGGVPPTFRALTPTLRKLNLSRNVGRDESLARSSAARSAARRLEM